MNNPYSHDASGDVQEYGYGVAVVTVGDEALPGWYDPDGLPPETQWYDSDMDVTDDGDGLRPCSTGTPGEGSAESKNVRQAHARSEVERR